MSKDLILLERSIHDLYVKYHSSGKARISLYRHQSELRALVSASPLATSLLVAKSVYRLNMREPTDPLTIRRHTPKSFLTLRPARTRSYFYQSQQDLATSIQNVITTTHKRKVIDQLATFSFLTVTQQILNREVSALRETSECLAVAIHEAKRVHTTC